MRGPPQPDRPSVSHLRAGCPPAPGPGRQSRLCLWPHLWLRTRRPRGHSRCGRNAHRPGCPGFRDSREAESPYGSSCNGSMVPISGGTQGPLHPAALVIRLRWNSPLGVSTGIAMRIATVWPDATASRACRIVAAKMVLPLAGPAGCPRVGDRRLCRRHLRDLEAVRGIRSTECCRALQTAAVEMAAVQAA
jgi:hypothetical protein